MRKAVLLKGVKRWSDKDEGDARKFDLGEGEQSLKRDWEMTWVLLCVAPFAPKSGEEDLDQISGYSRRPKEPNLDA